MLRIDAEGNYLYFEHSFNSITSVPKAIWEEGRVVVLSDMGRAVANMRSRNAVGQCGVVFIHEYG